MGASLDSVSDGVRAALERLGPEDQQRFLEERARYAEPRGGAGARVEQLCLVRLVRSRLAEGYAQALSRFEENLERKARMTEGWRTSTTRKKAGEYESPMPWLHPFRRAGEELEPLEEHLRAAVESGAREEARAATDCGDIERHGTEPDAVATLLEVLAKHDLALPLPAPHLQPRFKPGARAARGGR